MLDHSSPSGIGPASPALQGGFSTTGPPEKKSQSYLLNGLLLPPEGKLPEDRDFSSVLLSAVAPAVGSVRHTLNKD